MANSEELIPHGPVSVPPSYYRKGYNQNNRNSGGVKVDYIESGVPDLTGATTQTEGGSFPGDGTVLADTETIIPRGDGSAIRITRYKGRQGGLSVYDIPSPVKVWSEQFTVRLKRFLKVDTASTIAAVGEEVETGRHGGPVSVTVEVPGAYIYKVDFDSEPLAGSTKFSDNVGKFGTIPDVEGTVLKHMPIVRNYADVVWEIRYVYEWRYEGDDYDGWVEHVIGKDGTVHAIDRKA